MPGTLLANNCNVPFAHTGVFDDATGAFGVCLTVTVNDVDVADWHPFKYEKAVYVPWLENVTLLIIGELLFDVKPLGPVHV